MNLLHRHRPFALLLVLLAALAGCDRTRSELPTAAPAGGTGSALASEQFRVEPESLAFILLRCCPPDPFPDEPDASQAFTGSGTGAVKPGNAGGGGGSVGPEAGTTVKTLVLTNEGATVLGWTAADSVAWLAVSPGSGALAPGESVSLNVTVDAELPLGDYQTGLELTVGATTRAVPVAVTVVQGYEFLLGGEEMVWLAGEEGSERFYMISVPPRGDSLVIDLGIDRVDSGDADLYVRHGQLPTFEEYDCRPYHSTISIERCKVVEPAGGEHSIMVHGRTRYDAITLVVRFYGEPTAPPVPGPVSVQRFGRDARVSWADNSTNETAFRVRRSTRSPDGTFGPFQLVATLVRNRTSFDDYGDNGVALDGTYRYDVQACDLDMCSAPSPPSAPITISPYPPGDVTATGDGPLRVRIAWTNNDAQAFLSVRRSQRNGDGTFAPYQTVGRRGGTSPVLLDSTVVLGATYRYQVQACYYVLCSHSAPSAPITIVLPPGPPSGLAGMVVAGGEVDLTWADSISNETQFRVRRGTRNPDGSYTAYSTLRTLPGGTTTYADTSAVPGSVYRYQVQACNGGGCATSSALVVTVPALPAAPTGVSAAAVSSSQVNLGWTDASTNESQFRVRRTIRNPDGSYAPYQTIATRPAGVTSWQDTTVTAGATHRYIVQACNASGCGNSVSVGVSVPGS